MSDEFVNQVMQLPDIVEDTIRMARPNADKMTVGSIMVFVKSSLIVALERYLEFEDLDKKHAKSVGRSIDQMRKEQFLVPGDISQLADELLKRANMV